MAVIVTAFCLDSLLKIRLGTAFVQLAIPLMLLVPIWYYSFGIKRWANAGSRLRYDLLFPLLIGFAALQFGMARSGSAYLMILSYLVIAYFVYWSVSLAGRAVDWVALSRYALILLLVTGFVQYGLKNALGIDLFMRGLDGDYYEGKGTLGLRMRGFFLEPNWFGLMLFSWLYLFVGGRSRLSYIDKAIVGLSLIALFLSDNRTILVLLLLLAGYSRIRRYLGPVQWVMPLAVVSLFTGIYIFYSTNCGLVTDRSASARLCTSGNIIERWENDDLKAQLFGYGLSNWGSYSNELGFSRSNYKRDQPLTRRDNAEPYVFLFEMGLFSFLIFAIDLLVVGKRASRAMDAMFVAAIYTTALFYPIYTFLPYIFPLAIVRARIFTLPARPRTRAASRTPAVPTAPAASTSPLAPEGAQR